MFHEGSEKFQKPHQFFHTRRAMLFYAALILGVFTITAFNSSGYFHADEHYQILEFANYKLGNSEISDLAWEFEARIRPALQVFVAYAIISISEFLHVSDPFHQALILRLLTACLSLLVIAVFIRANQNKIRQDLMPWYILLSCLLWFIPLVGVRFSSETWSGLFFLPGLSMIIRSDKKHYLRSGVLFGFSFLFRYQIALAIAELLIWALSFEKMRLKAIFEMAAGILVSMASGLICDLWLYGEFTLTPWNYLRVNLIEGKASTFGTSPWYYYFFLIFRYSFFPVGIVLLLMTVFFTINRFKSLYTGIILSFFVLHALIPHKELRFLFPVVNILPLILMLTYQDISKRFNIRKSVFIKLFIVLLVLINSMGLFVVMLKPAGFGRIALAQQIDKKYQGKTIDLYHFKNTNPYDPWGGLNADFYMQNDIRPILLDGPEHLQNIIPEEGTASLLVLKSSQMDNRVIQQMVEQNQLERTDQSFPRILNLPLKLYGYKTDEILILLEIKMNPLSSENRFIYPGDQEGTMVDPNIHTTPVHRHLQYSDIQGHLLSARR